MQQRIDCVVHRLKRRNSSARGHHARSRSRQPYANTMGMSTATPVAPSRSDATCNGWSTRSAMRRVASAPSAIIAKYSASRHGKARRQRSRPMLKGAAPQHLERHRSKPTTRGERYGDCSVGALGGARQLVRCSRARARDRGQHGPRSENAHPEHDTHVATGGCKRRPRQSVPRDQEEVGQQRAADRAQRVAGVEQAELTTGVPWPRESARQHGECSTHQRRWNQHERCHH